MNINRRLLQRFLFKRQHAINKLNYVSTPESEHDTVPTAYDTYALAH